MRRPRNATRGEAGSESQPATLVGSQPATLTEAQIERLAIMVIDGELDTLEAEAVILGATR